MTSRLALSAAAAATLFLAGGAFAATPAADSALRWVPSSMGGSTLDPASRLRLVRTAAERAGLKEVGLDFRDVYGVIHAETSWVPRDGKGRNGVTSIGLAQFEPATAKAVGLRDPNNAVEAVNAAARLLREAAEWSARRIAGLGLPAQERSARLREGVSVYYNLSSQARNAWNGLNTDRLPVETQRHILNVRAGAVQADQLNARLGGPKLAPLPAEDLLRVAGDDERGERAAPSAKKSAKPHPVGSIAWAGSGRGGARSYIVLSDGSLRPQGKGEVPPGAIQWTPRGKG